MNKEVYIISDSHDDFHKLERIGLKVENSACPSSNRWAGSKRGRPIVNIFRGGMSWINGVARSTSFDYSSTEKSVADKSGFKRGCGCLKGSRQPSQEILFKKVRFNLARSNIELHQIEAFSDQKCDLWWSKNEIQQIRQTLVNSNDMKKHYSYLKACREARSQFEIKQEKILPKIAADVYESLLLGRRNGFAGLEMHYYGASRRKKVKKIVDAVVAAYRDGKAQGRFNETDESNFFRYAQNLTEEDRLWAAISGKADMDAIYRRKS